MAENAKGLKVKATMRHNKERRKELDVAVYQLKIDESHLSKEARKPVELDDGRKFFGVPIRYITREFYPEKMSLEEFQKDILSTDEFIKNIKSLGINKREFYIEQWMEIFANWNEIEQKE